MKYNLYSCLISSVVTTAAAYLLIPAFTLVGAAFTNVISYLINVTILIFIFMIKYEISVKDLIIQKSDLLSIKNILKQKISS